MNKQKGFTLVELLVTLVIMALLVSVAIPGFQGMLARNNLATSANAVLIASNLARGEAVRVGGGTSLVALPATPVNAANDWGGGWQVLDSDATLLRQFGAPSGVLTLDSPTGVTTVQFTARGALTGGAPVVLNLCEPGVGGVAVTISAVGRASTANLTAAGCP